MEQHIKAYITILDTPGRRVLLAIKRLVDIVGASAALLVLSPLLALLALLIRLESPGPVIFTQQRLGQYGRVFTMYKFRSMRHNAPVHLNADGSTRVVDNDPRVTRLGQLMRRSGMDELPQLFNILRGDMSLIGPRPDPAFYIDNYCGTDYYKLAMRPGLTALAHVLGRQTIGWRERFAIERYYIENLSPWREVLIIWLTLVVIWRGIGVTNGNTPPAPARTMLPSLPTLPRWAPAPTLRMLSVNMLALPLVVGTVGLLAPPNDTEARVVRPVVKPVVECVTPHEDGSFTAVFGYENTYGYEMEITVGGQNRFHPAPRDRGQPTVFQDGRQRAVFQIESSGGNLMWILSGRTATASINHPNRCPPPHTPAPVSDFNGDDSVDLLWRHAATGENGMWLMERTERLAYVSLNTVDDTNWRIVGLHDFDGDYHADVLWRHATTGENILWLMESEQRRELAGLNTVDDTNWRIEGLHDFDGDGKSDILWRHATTGGNIVWLMDGTSRSGLGGLNTVSDTDWRIEGLHDFDGDGKSDILWRHAATGDNIIWFMDGFNRLLVYGTDRVSDPAWQIIGAGNFDGDSTSDILWRNTDTGANVIWLMDGYTRTETVSLNALSDQDWRIVSIQDFDGDGKSDMLWRHATTGANAIWSIDGTTRKAVVPLNTVDDVGWQVVDTGIEGYTLDSAALLRDAATLNPLAPSRSLAAAHATMLSTPDEPPGAVMPDEGRSRLMPDEPLTEVPHAMGLHTVHLPFVTNP